MRIRGMYGTDKRIEAKKRIPIVREALNKELRVLKLVKLKMSDGYIGGVDTRLEIHARRDGKLTIQWGPYRSLQRAIEPKGGYDFVLLALQLAKWTAEERVRLDATAAAEVVAAENEKRAQRINQRFKKHEMSEVCIEADGHRGICFECDAALSDADAVAFMQLAKKLGVGL